jgi:acetate---CoA ligase (ADP-forming)
MSAYTRTEATTSELDALFEPRAVALIGASADPQSISARPLRLLRQHGFAGKLYPVNPKYAELNGLRVHPAIGSVPERVDLALIMVPAAVVASVLDECAAAGVRCALVITSGFAESGPGGQALQERISDVVSRSGMRVCGPNSEGLYKPSNGLCATFSPAVDPEHGFEPTRAGGQIAIVSQSGGLAFALLNHAQDRGLSVGSVLSTGNEVDLTWTEYVEYLLDQADIRVVLGFVEAVRQPERLVQVARKAARLKKPLIVAKMGRSEPGRRAAASHTASLVGSDAAYSAVFRQLGILRVDDVDDMLDLAAYFCTAPPPAGRRVAVLTASGGAGAWLADACATRGLEVPPPPAAVQENINSFIPSYGSVANPVDITAQAALSGGFERALGLLAHCDGFESVLAVATLVREERFFETFADLRRGLDGAQSVVVFYSYTRASPRVVQALAELGIPCFSTPGRTAGAVAAAADYAAFIRRADDVGVFAGRSLLEAWPVPDGPLSETGARAWLAPLGIASPRDALARSADEAVAAFEALGGKPVVLKIQSPHLSHKAAMGGVKLDVSSSDDVRAAFGQIMAAVHAAREEATIEGVLVQLMAPPGGVEVLVAARREPLVGPLVVVGLGGTEVEWLNDIAMRLAPVSLAEARAMLDELRGCSVLRSRGDVEALAEAVVRVSRLAAVLPPGVGSVEINPLLVLPPGQGVLMLDAVVEMEGTGPA